MPIIKKLFIILVPLVVITIVFLLGVLVLGKESGKGALQVTATPKSKVYLDGKFVGETPLCLCELSQMLEARDHTLKVEPQDQKLSFYQEKIRILSGVLTVVDRTFENESSQSGSIITLTPLDDKNKTELLVTSFPNKANVIIDSQDFGKTPLLVKKITPSDHELRLTYEGFKDKKIRVRSTSGYRLEALIDLSVVPITGEIATSAATPKVVKVTILETPTGFLRVRSDASLSSEELDRVVPGETLDLLEEKGDYFKIKLKNGNSGWISNQYASKAN